MRTPAQVPGYWAVVVAVALVLLGAQQGGGLIITRDFTGGTPGTNNAGSGNLQAIFNTAADIWEQAILDEHSLVLHYGWAPVGGGLHVLNAQGGSPNREVEGTILFNNDDRYWHWFLDPTPGLNEEFPVYREASQDLGAGLLNVTRVFRGRVGFPIDKQDLLTAALHEIGHALGMSRDNTSYVVETSDDHSVEIRAPLPFVGVSIPMLANAAHIGDINNDFVDRVIMNGWSADERVVPTSLDILAVAQLSGFERLNLNLSPSLNLVRVGADVLNCWWSEPIPGFGLERCASLGPESFWETVPESFLLSNSPPIVSLVTTGATGFFRLKRTNDFCLALTKISQDPPDVDPVIAGTQARAGSTFQYSASVTNGTGREALMWYWMYSVDGGTNQGFELGSGTPPARQFTYGADQVGHTYTWKLTVFIGDEVSASTRLDVSVLVPPLPH